MITLALRSVLIGHSVHQSVRRSPRHLQSGANQNKQSRHKQETKLVFDGGSVWPIFLESSLVSQMF